MEKISQNLPAAELIRAAMEARKKAYAPYSGYYVGAAVLTGEERIYTGCNIENASYGAAVCAERTAIFKAVSEGRSKCKALAVVGGPRGDKPADYAFPCGICRQVMAEFTDTIEEFTVIVARGMADYQIFSLAELLPSHFSGKNLRK